MVEGDLAEKAQRLEIEGDRDETRWVVVTKTGELYIANIESVKQLLEDVRDLPSGYSIRDLLLVVRGKEQNPEIYKLATSLFTPEEKIAIADDALENIMCLNDDRIARAVKTFQDGRGEIFIVTAEDYQTFRSAYYTGRSESELLYSGGEFFGAKPYEHRIRNRRSSTSEVDIPMEDALIIIVGEQNVFNRNNVVRVATMSSGSATARYKEQAKLATTRILTHELLHGAGIGLHLGNMQEMVTEFYAIRAQTLGEEKRGQGIDSLNMGYATSTTMFAMLYEALMEREGVEMEVLDRAFMWGVDSDMQRVLKSVNNLLGPENATRLKTGNFKNDAEAYIWLRDILNPKQ